MNKVITKIRSGIGGYLKDNILFLTFVFASVLNGFLLRAFTVKFNYSQIKPLMADMAVILLLALISYVFKKPRKQFPENNPKRNSGKKWLNIWQKVM